MTTKPDDIPQWAWDCVEGLPLHGDSYCDDDDLATIARAILKAKNDAYEEAYAEVRKLRLQTALDGGMVENPYINVYKVSQAIRNLKHKTEV